MYSRKRKSQGGDKSTTPIIRKLPKIAKKFALKTIIPKSKMFKPKQKKKPQQVQVSASWSL